MGCLGFGHNDTKRYGVAEDKPEGWPDNIQFASLPHTSSLNLNQVNTVIASLLRKRNINPDNFHYEDTPEEGPKRKRRKKHDTSEELDNFGLETVSQGDENDAGNENNNEENGNEPAQNNGELDGQALNEQPNYQQPYLDESGRWYWDFYNQQWYPYYPPSSQ